MPKSRARTPDTTTPGGVVVPIHVIPRSGRAGIAGTRAGALIVRLHAPPVDGAANTELIEILSEVLEVPRRMLTIVSGERGRQKRVLVAGGDPREIQARIAARMPASD